MGNLIAIIFSIVLGAAAVALTLVYLGNGFADKSVEAEAQKVINNSHEIEVALLAYKAENAGIVLGDGVTTPMFKPLVESGYLKEDINTSIEESNLQWQYDEAQKVVKKVIGSDSNAEEQCKEINIIRHGALETDDVPDCAANEKKWSCCVDNSI